MDPAQMVGIGIGIGLMALMLLIVFIKANLVICQPNEVVIISGRGKGDRGYRVIKGGRGFKWPIAETVSRLSLTNIPIEIRIKGALCKGVIPIHIEGRANVKIAGSAEEGLDNAIERFLGRNLAEVNRVARETIEGSLRGVIATVTPDEANGRRMEVGERVAESAGHMLRKLGLVLDFFQVQNISDDQDYLAAIARQKNAEVRKNAQIAEATAEAEARSVKAAQQRTGRLAEVAAEEAIATAEHGLAIHKATLECESSQAVQRAAVAGPIARVEEEQRLEEGRVVLNRKRYEAETVIPAQAESKALQLKAEGQAAIVRERGKATADAVNKMREQWEGGESKDLFLIQMFPELVDSVTQVVAKNLRVERLTVLDSGEGNGLPNYVKNVTNSALVLLEQVKNATGMDLPELIQSAAKRNDGPPALPKELG